VDNPSGGVALNPGGGVEESPLGSSAMFCFPY
jgi:hypothetical protein